MLLYHGTNAEFTEFSLDFAGRPDMSSNGHLGVWLATTPALAGAFGLRCLEVRLATEKAYSMPIDKLSRLNREICKQSVAVESEEAQRKVEAAFYRRLRLDLIARGFDAIYVAETDLRNEIVIALDPSRISIVRQLQPTEIECHADKRPRAPTIHYQGHTVGDQVGVNGRGGVWLVHAIMPLAESDRRHRLHPFPDDKNLRRAPFLLRPATGEDEEIWVSKEEINSLQAPSCGAPIPSSSSRSLLAAGTQIHNPNEPIAKPEEQVGNAQQEAPRTPGVRRRTSYCVI